MAQRASQVAEELRKIISMILLRDIQDPKLGFITITRIDMTDDLRYARVYYSVLGDEAKRDESRKALQEHGPEIRRLAIQRINMKYAMQIKFILDESLEESMKIDQILQKIKKEEKK